MSKKNFVILTSFAHTERDYIRFGIETLSKNFNLYLIDLTSIHNKKMKKVFFYGKEKYTYIKLNTLLDLFFYDFTKFDFMFDQMSSIHLSSMYLRYKIKKQNCKTIITSHGLQPYIFKENFNYQVQKYIPKDVMFLKKIYYKFIFFTLIPTFLKRRLSLYLFNKYQYYYVLLTCLESHREFKTHQYKYNIKHHTFDYDRYLESLKDNKKYKQDYILFIDQDFLDHPDYKYTGTPPIPKSYIDNTTKFLKNLESELKLKVKIAGHPKSITRNSWVNFEVVYDDTLNLIKNSKIVLGHFSTAISYAIIFKKKILLFVTPEMQGTYRENQTHNYAYSINKKYYKMNKEYIKNSEIDKYLEIDYLAYNKFIDQYIKYPGLKQKDSDNIFVMDKIVHSIKSN